MMNHKYGCLSWKGWRLIILLPGLVLGSCQSLPSTMRPTEAELLRVTPTSTPTERLTPTNTTESIVEQATQPTLDNIIPRPVSVTATGGTFSLTSQTRLYVEPGTKEMMAIGQYLADKLKPATGFVLPLQEAAGNPPEGSIFLTTAGGDPALGEEGYDLTITSKAVQLSAYQPAGLFRGIQTLRQLLPASIESPVIRPGPWQIATGEIRDFPRFAWRGVMLDVARHFFSVGTVKRFIDLAALYKLNRFHLHLSDDQGWRIMINTWPNLATYGGSSEVGGGPGGYYSQAEYAEIIAYAQSRYITIVPEIDMPGHTNAALASYSELNCNERSAELYTGTRVGFSSLCVDKEVTYDFIEAVLGEIASLTPGAYLHIGGDEAQATQADEYKRFIERVSTIVEALKKRMVGWEEIAQADLPPTAIAQHWNSDLARRAIQRGLKVIMSPASKAYLDMKYEATTPLGLDWAGYITVKDAYSWDPATLVSGVSEADILGIEAPLWSETLQTMADIEFMAFPRLMGYAEIGWSPAMSRDWDEYRLRLGSHGPRLTALGVNFYPSPQVPWK